MHGPPPGTTPATHTTGAPSHRPLVIVTFPHGAGVLAVPLLGAGQAADGSWWGTVGVPGWELRDDGGRTVADVVEMPLLVPWDALSPVEGESYDAVSPPR